MDAPVIYHLTTLQEWEEAQDQGSYAPSSYEREGFIHCATEEQLDGVIQKHFQQHENLVKLIIDPTRLTERLKYEKVGDGDQEYPHIYGPLNLEAVTQIVFLDPITSEER
jgi:uncharacterized protein (DUF952 family)